MSSLNVRGIDIARDAMRCALTFGCLLLTSWPGECRSGGPIHAPQDDALVIGNGTRWNNRPLCCHERFPFVWSGETPALKGEMGTLYAGIERGGEAIWLLVSGSTTPMQGKIANAVLRFRYADGREETLELVPPENFWSLCRFGNVDYSRARDGFALPQVPPPMVRLGTNCRAMVYGWKLRPGAVLKDVTLETLSLDVVIGLMAASIMNPQEPGLQQVEP